MSCDDAAEIRIEPCDVSWEIEAKWQVKTVKDTASSLNSKYFKIYNGANEGFYVWLNVAAAGVDPAPAGFTELAEVAIAANATAAAVAAAIQAAVDAHADFAASVLGDVVTIENVDAGEADDLIDGTAPTGFTFTQCRVGGVLDCGELDGDITFTPDVKTLEIFTHQGGATAKTELLQGVNGTLAIVMKESDFAKWQPIFETAGGSDTPMGGTEVFGMGTGKSGESVVKRARRLVLHPVSAGNSKARDFCAWLAYPKPGEQVISGENPRTQAVEFKFYPDKTKPSNINMAVFGDWSQYLPE